MVYSSFLSLATGIFNCSRYLATVRRASFLGAFTDYQLDVCGQHVRTAVDTHEALARDLLLAEGDECVINLRNAHWFS